jgi:hypothetical protein
MSKPHPSIAYSVENDADGLQFYPPDREQEPYTLHRYIRSRGIESELAKIEAPCTKCEETDGELIIYANRLRPLSEDDLARRDRFLARLELSREYE